MIEKKMEDAINKQINEEAYSAYLYMSMSAYFSSVNLLGFAHWMLIQAHEEYMHSKIFYNFILDRGGRINLAPIEGPKTEWKSAEEAFADAYKHEQHITSCINTLMDLSISLKDHASTSMLNWFVSEQVEEEANASGILEKIKLAAGNSGGLFMIDKDLAARVFNTASFPITE